MSAEPPLVLIHGDASPEEVAALVAVVSSRTRTAPRERPLRQPLSAWVASGLVKGTRTRA